MAKKSDYVTYKVARRIPWYVWRNKETGGFSEGAEKPSSTGVLQKTTRLVGIDIYRMPIDQFLEAAEKISETDESVSF